MWMFSRTQERDPFQILRLVGYIGSHQTLRELEKFPSSWTRLKGEFSEICAIIVWSVNGSSLPDSESITEHAAFFKLCLILTAEGSALKTPWRMFFVRYLMGDF